MRTRAKSKINILNLPIEVLSLMAAYLPFKDILNFRLTCKWVYEAVHCKKVMEKLKFCPPKYENTILTFIKNVHGGKHINLVLTNLETTEVKRILQHGPKLCSLALQVQHVFKGLECLCPSLQYLYLNITNPLKHKGSRKLYYYFQALSELSHLKTLVLFGDSNSNSNPGLLNDQEIILPSETIISILESVKQITTFKLSNVHISINNRLAFQKSLKCFSNVQTWSFFHVTTSWTGFKIPLAVKSLNCQFTNFVPIDTEHTDLDKIIIITKQPIKVDNGVIQVLQQDQESLFWTLYAKIKRGVISVESVDVKFFRVQMFNMPYCTISGFLDNDMNGVADAISELYINEKLPLLCQMNLDNSKLASLLKKLNNLKYLELCYMENITADFLGNVSFENMDTITIRKCKHLSSKIVNEKLKCLHPAPVFKVEIIE